MPKAFSTWTVLPHGPIVPLASNLWQVTGSLPDMPIGRAMTIARMEDGRLLIHNAMALEDSAMKEIEAWGEPAYIVVPNGWHRLDSAVFRARYPGAKVVCPAGSRKKVEQVVAVDLDYDAMPGDGTVALAHVDGLKQAEGVVTVRSEDGVSLVFNDLVFNLAHGPGLFGLVFRLLGSTGGPRVTRLFRLTSVKDRKALRAHLERLAATPDLVRIVPGHGALIDRDAAAVLAGIAGRL